jgi:gas vesicle protein
MSRVSVIFGALAGMAAGALFGILFAPDKGTETRKKIVHQGEDYVDDLKERVNSILNNGSKHSEKVKVSA